MFKWFGYALFVLSISGCTTLYVNPKYPNNTQYYFNRDYNACNAYALSRIPNQQVYVNSRGTSYTNGNVNVYDNYGNSAQGTFSSQTNYYNPMATGADLANMASAFGTMAAQQNLREQCMASKGWRVKNEESEVYIQQVQADEVKKQKESAAYKKLVGEYVHTYCMDSENPEGYIEKMIKGRKSGDSMAKAATEYILHDKCDVAFNWLNELKKVDPESYRVMRARMFINGDCGKKDIKEAAELLGYGSSGDIKSTYVRLFIKTAKLKNCPMDREVGFLIAKSLAECGHKYSAKYLARIYYQGLGTTKNYEKAYIWYMVAAYQTDVMVDKEQNIECAKYVKETAGFSEEYAQELRNIAASVIQKIMVKANSSSACLAMNVESKTSDYFISDVPFQGAGSVENVFELVKLGKK